MVTVWNQIVELQAASKYMIQNYEAIFTPDIVQALHERFKGVESTCGVDVTHGNISSILEKMSSNSIQHQDLYGMISITEEVIEIYHNNHDNLLDVLYS